MKDIENKNIETPKKKKKERKWTKRLLLLFFTIFTVGVVSIFAGVLYIDYKLEDMPITDAQYLKTYSTSKITDMNGESIWEPTDKRVKTITYEEIPETYKEFIVAVEDQDFWSSKGFSPKGIANMVVGTIRSKVDDDYKARGGSTIDQQLIKNKYYDRGYGHSITTRKIQELFLSRQLNENFTKKEILTFYLNDLQFAEGATGIKTIMKTYFNKSPADYEERTIENIAEQAYLAGLSQAPSAYNLYVEPENAHKRMKTVLGIVKEKELISEKEYKEASNFDLTTNLQERSWESNAQRQKNLKYKTYTDGVMDELSDIGYNIDEITLEIKTHLNPKTYESIEAMVRDSKYYLDKDQQMAVSVIDSDGIVVGMVGARYEGDELNRATQQTRSSGSSTKPFLAYIPLLQYFGDQYSTASQFDTSNYPYPGSKAVMRNYGMGTYGNQTMQTSLRKSYNTPVGRIMDGKLGSDRVKQLLARVGLDVKDKYTSVDGLGINVSTLQTATAFNTLNNLGQHTPARFIDTISFSNGETKEIKPEVTKAITPSVAWTVNHMLRGVPMDGGTAKNAEIKGYSGYAGKTGTVGFSKSIKAPAPYGIGSSDLWFNSMTNEGYSISVWTGYDKPNSSPQLPSRYKGQQLLSRDLQKMLNGDKVPKVWAKPDGVQLVSGEGLNAHYRVTDSKDSVFRSPSWVEPSKYKSLDIERVIGNDEVKPSWEEEAMLSPWYEYYKDGKSLSPDVINEDTYRKITGETVEEEGE